MKPLAFIDCEATGLDVATEAIFEFALFQVPAVFPHTRAAEFLIKPWKPIPPEIEKLTGRTNAMLENCPTFKEVASQIHALLCQFDLGGFNLRQYDIPLLFEELFRAGIEWHEVSSTVIIDAGTLYKIREERTLSAAMQFYCQKDHVGAHSALADASAAGEVFAAQIKRYPDLAGLDPLALAKATEYDGPKRASLDGKIRYNDEGEAVYAFGKHDGKRVRDHQDYASWMISKAFPEQTKMVLRTLLSEYARQRRGPTQKSLL